MQLARGIRNVVAFLTILPVGMDRDGFTLAAEYMVLFPIIGALIGLLGGAFVWILEFFFPSLIAAALGLGILLLVNGAQHVDGLLDFGDGIMCHGSRARKLRVMRDPQTGAGGFTLGWIVLSATAFAIASLSQGMVVRALIFSEAAASFSMVFQTWAGKPAHRGMFSFFSAAMRSNGNARILASSIILLLVGFVTLPGIGLIVTLSAVAVPLVILSISNHAFGGITGDVLGATNELTRLTLLLVIVAGMRWV